jgi:hypothetical protein
MTPFCPCFSPLPMKSTQLTRDPLLIWVRDFMPVPCNGRFVAIQAVPKLYNWNDALISCDCPDMLHWGMRAVDGFSERPGRRGYRYGDDRLVGLARWA